GRKRHLVVDTLGLLLAVAVTSAAVDDGAAAPQVLRRLEDKELPRLGVLWADQKYHNHALYEWLAGNAWYTIEVVRRPAGQAGFVLLADRWVVERTRNANSAWPTRRVTVKLSERKTRS